MRRKPSPPASTGDLRPVVESTTSSVQAVPNPPQKSKVSLIARRLVRSRRTCGGYPFSRKQRGLSLEFRVIACLPLADGVVKAGDLIKQGQYVDGLSVISAMVAVALIVGVCGWLLGRVLGE